MLDTYLNDTIYWHAHINIWCKVPLV